MDSFNLQGSTLNICADRDELSLRLAERFVTLANDAVSDHGRFTVALSGGSTPKGLYSLLAEPAFRDRVPWSKTELFWGDERCVPQDSTDSNYKMVKDSLLSQVAIPSSNVHPTAGQDTDPELAANDYEIVVRQLFQVSGESLPSFDLILLGLGPDGHTASLFPATAALHESAKLVVANYVDKFKSYRITFTLPLLNSAAHVIFMVAGEDKTEILPQVLKPEPLEYPAQLICPSAGTLEWYVDQAAARNLDMKQLAGVL